MAIQPLVLGRETNWLEIQGGDAVQDSMPLNKGGAYFGYTSVIKV